MSIREISKADIVETVKNLAMDAAVDLPEDVYKSICSSKERETNVLAKSILGQLEENAEIARSIQVPICQDTGLAIVFIEVGYDVHFSFDLYAAVNEGIKEGYEQAYLRKSVVRHPIDRVNTKDNTPAVVHLSLVSGDRVRIIVAPKGGGSENMSMVKVFPPSVGIDGVVAFVTDVVKSAGSNPCPPIILGVGIGGTMEMAALLSKKALLREIGNCSSNKFDKDLEDKILKSVNGLDIGAGGYGGDITALAVFVESYPCHIASLPVAVTIQCHAARHKEAYI